MEQVYRIRNMKKFEGKSLRKIAEITGHDFSTVKKYVEIEDFNHEIHPKQKRDSKLSPYRNIVLKWLSDDKRAPHKQQHTARRVFDRLKELYPDEFDAHDRSVRKFVSNLRKELQVNTDGFLPLEHPPGEAQADFGEARFVENGLTYDGYYFNISYPHSNAGHTQLFKSANQECLLEGMKAIFEHIGGVPVTIWFDNMSTAVKKIKEYGERDLTKGFLRFMLHHGFQSNFCNPNSGNEKGSVENKVGYHRRNLFVPVPEFKDLKEYNKQFLERCDKDMNRMHYKGYGLIKDLFRRFTVMNSEELIKHYCKELRFGRNIFENYSKIEAVDYGDFLAQLLKLEIEHREISRKNRNLKAAGFDIIKTFEGYDFKDIQIPPAIAIDELKAGRFIDKLENLILYGPVGTGKSHMAAAIGVAACSRGKKAKFFRTASLVNQLSEAKAKGELKRFMKQIEKADLLICDEWGYVPFEKEGSQLLFQVISECYEKRSVIITTNLEFSKWNGIFYDEKLTSAIIDRLVHHSHLLVFNGPSYRLTHSTMNSQ